MTTSTVRNTPEEALRRLVQRPMSGLTFSLAANHQQRDLAQCVYCHREQLAKPPFRHDFDCPIRLGRLALGLKAVAP